MKNVFTFLFCSLFIYNATAQNLISNSSFEDTVHCPYGYDQLNASVGWSSYRYSPDYMNSCSNPSIVGVPDNSWGDQAAFDANAYAALATFSSYRTNYREFIGTHLVQPLSIGAKYFVSANISRADNTDTKGASSNFGFRFSTISYSGLDPAPIDNFSHIHCDSIVKNQTDWTWVGGAFVADSSYEYLIIGNFYDDSHTDTFDCPSYALYYIDMICVSVDSLNCNSLFDGDTWNEATTGVSIYPNPVKLVLLANLTGLGCKKYSLINSFGKIMKEGLLVEHLNQIDVSMLPNGIYIFNLENRIQQTFLIIQ